MTAAGTRRRAYEAAGVDVAAGERSVELLRARLGGGAAVDLLGGLGGFAAAVEIPGGLRRPVLVSATDGVGTKTEIARLLGRYDTLGRDVVAMCADDVVCHGARPHFFLDYLAVGRVVPQRVDAIVAGIAEACAEVGAELIGGETAEHPGVMAPDQLDLAGFCIGFVERERLIDGSAARAGDAVIGLASSGLHANGYSLVRALLDDGRLELSDDLLEPTRLYAADVLALLDHAAAAGWRIGGVAHITGAGLPGNLPRAVGPDLGVEVDPRAWPVPEVISRVALAAGIDGPEMRATLNGGIGMAVMLDPATAAGTLDLLAGRGVEAWQIGRVRAAGEIGGRYRESG
ncbi:phosphoribosylformylglycinamidine cyclo-ligase [soil metagenome]